MGVSRAASPTNLFNPKSCPTNGVHLICPFFRINSGEHFLNHPATIYRRPFVAAVVEVGQFFILKAAAVEDCGVDVVDVDFVLGGPQADRVGRAVRDAAADAAAG